MLSWNRTLSQILANTWVLIEQGKKIMAGEADLKAAIAANGAAVTTLANNINSIISSALGDPDADIEDLANQLKAQTAQMLTIGQNLSSPAPIAPPPVTAPTGPTGS